jgi:hypothetical protein
MAKGRFKAILSAMDVMGCSLRDAQYIVHVLGDSNSMDTFA